jgi:hypothetical protein
MWTVSNPLDCDVSKIVDSSNAQKLMFFAHRLHIENLSFFNRNKEFSV